MSTWHDNDLLLEALLFLLSCIWPDEYAEETMGSTIAISIGNPAYAEEIRSAPGDPRAFTQRVWIMRRHLITIACSRTQQNFIADNAITIGSKGHQTGFAIIVLSVGFGSTPAVD